MLKTLERITTRIAEENKAAEEKKARMELFVDEFHDSFCDISAWLAENVDYSFTATEGLDLIKDVLDAYFSNEHSEIHFYSDAVEAVKMYAERRKDSLHSEAEKILSIMITILTNHDKLESVYAEIRDTVKKTYFDKAFSRVIK